MNKEQEEKLREDFRIIAFVGERPDDETKEAIADYWIAQLTAQKERIVKKIEECISKQNMDSGTESLVLAVIGKEKLEELKNVNSHINKHLSDLKSDIINDNF